MDKIKQAIIANIEVHSVMADEYNKIEPHFRPESIKRVDRIISNINLKRKIDKVLDLGCGTGFMINIVKKYASEITGVDVTQAMMDKVDLTGKAKIDLINSDTGTVNLPENYYDLATAYTFLDHLYDMTPTFKNAFKSLKNGGIFYADLSPNHYFWKNIKSLDLNNKYHSVVQREINAVLNKDAEIEQQFGIDKQTFKAAEFQKHLKGGLVEEELKEILLKVGFKKVDFIYHWFIGQAQIINDDKTDVEIRFKNANLINELLTNVLPLSRNLFKYVGFIAEK